MNDAFFKVAPITEPSHLGEGLESVEGRSDSFAKALLGWFDKHKAPHPWRLLWQRQADPYHIWLSEIMLQQTVLKAVYHVWEPFLQAFPTVQAVAAASEDDVKKAVQGLGYYRRFRLFHKAAQQISQEPWPETYEGWLALPGVGAYTAAAVSSIAFGQVRAVVDGNVERVICRLWDVRLPVNLPALRRHYQSIADLLISHKRPGDYNQAIMELGQRICKQTPLCYDCPVSSHCRSFKRQTFIAPLAKIKAARKKTQVSIMLYTHGDLVGLLRREHGFLKGMLGFPLERHADANLLGHFKHTITIHDITAEVCRHELDAPTPNLQWVPRHHLKAALTASLDVKALAFLYTH